MSDTQFYIWVTAGPVTTLIAVLIGVLLSNARFGDVDRHFGELQSLIEVCSNRHDAILRRIEEMALGKFAELDTRLSRIEHHLNLG